MTERLIVHVLPNDLARGGQAIARDVKAALDGLPHRHRILTLFSSEPVLLSADDCLGVRMGRLRGLGLQPGVLPSLRRRLRHLAPDVVVAHGGEPLKYLVLSGYREAPLVYFSFGIVTDAARRGVRRALYRVLMHRADVVAGISHETAEEARDLFGVRPEQIAVLPNGRDPTVFHPAPPQTRGPVRLVFVGHLTATKRPEWFVSAVAELRRRGHPVSGRVVGDGPLEGQVRAAAERAGVDVLGRRVDVPELLRDADVLVFTSVPESEGMPGVLIEAGLTGLPVVATAAPGVTTVLQAEVTGLVVDHTDFDGLIAALEKVVSDPDRRLRMGAAARERCVREFSVEVMGQRWAQMLDGLLAMR